MNIQGHVLLFCVSNIEKVGSDWPLRSISGEIQHHHAQHGEDDANWLASWPIAKGKTC